MMNEIHFLRIETIARRFTLCLSMTFGTMRLKATSLFNL